MNCESSERDEPEGEDAGGVRRRHRRAEQERVPRLAARADEVAGDERLPVPRREGVDCAPEGGDQEREQDHAEREVAALDQRLEAPVAVLRRRRDPDRRAPAPAELPGVYSTVALRDVERRAEEALRVGAELVAERLVAGRRARDDARAVAGGDDDLAPADPVPVARDRRTSAACRSPRARKTASKRIVCRPPAPGRSERAVARGRSAAPACRRRGDRGCARGSPRSRASAPPLPPGRSGSRPGRARSGRRRRCPRGRRRRSG